MLAAAAAVLVIAGGWHGVDLAAHMYSVAAFRRSGFVLWDSQWFGGHWTLGYSVLYSPLAALAGIPLSAVVSAAVAAWAFHRLIEGRTSRVTLGAVLFSVGTVAQVAIGQLPFLMGEALGLCALVALQRRHWVLAALLATATSLFSPLAGLFLAVGIVAWLVVSDATRRWKLGGVAACAIVPLGIFSLLFPQGDMPFATKDFVIAFAAFAALPILIPSRQRALRAGAFLYLAVLVAGFVVPSGLGANAIRLGGCVALPLAVCFIETNMRRFLAVALLVPVLVGTWAPVWTSATAGRTAPSTSAKYYAPLLSYLRDHRDPLGRVEVVPTAMHWEAVYVAAVAPLARGWERQLDIADDPIFYRHGALTATSYRAWLRDNGVRYVALSDAPVDYAGRAERTLLGHPIAGIRLAWSSAHWRVFAVEGSPGIVSGDARLVSMASDQVTLRLNSPGSVLIRIHPNANWAITAGDACLTPTRSGLSITADHAEQLVLRVALLQPGGAGSRKSC
jgi:hypothetical protein